MKEPLIFLCGILIAAAVALMFVATYSAGYEHAEKKCICGSNDCVTNIDYTRQQPYEEGR